MTQLVRENPKTQIRTVFSGFVAHGSRPDLGINAVDAAALALTAARALPHEGNARIQVISLDAGGSSINMIPDRVVMLLDVTAENEDLLSALVTDVQHAMARAASAIGAKVECKEGDRL